MDPAPKLIAAMPREILGDTARRLERLADRHRHDPDVSALLNRIAALARARLGSG